MIKVFRPRAGDIGEPRRQIEFEPLPDDVPVPEQTPAPAPTEPAKQPEPVPA